MDDEGTPPNHIDELSANSLVVAMFNDMRRAQRDMQSSISQILTWMSKTEEHLANLDKRVEKQNGGVAEALRLCADLQESKLVQIIEAEGYQKGRKAVKEEQRRAFIKAKNIATHNVTLYALIAICSLVGLGGVADLIDQIWF